MLRHCDAHVMLSAYGILCIPWSQDIILCLKKPMRYKRTRSSRKYLKYLERKGDFRKPYQILVEDAFLDQFSKYKHSMHSFKILMLGEPTFFISECCYRTYKKTSSSHDNDFIKHCKIRKCPYQCTSTLECVLSILRKRNKHHFFVAAANPQIIDKLMATYCAPVITAAKGGLHFMTKSKRHVKSVEDEEDHASDTSLKNCALNERHGE